MDRMVRLGVYMLRGSERMNNIRESPQSAVKKLVERTG